MGWNRWGSPLLVFSCLIFALLQGCGNGDGGGGTANEQDQTSPEVVAVTPTDGQTDVPTNALVTVTFSEPIDFNSINPSTFPVTQTALQGAIPLSGVFSIDPTNTIVTFTPDHPLALLATYVATVTHGVTDLSGNGLVNGNPGNANSFSWSFTTGTQGDASPPTAPANLTATAVSIGQINLSWTASSDNVGIAGYRVERCQGDAASCTSNPTDFVEIHTTTTTVYNDTGLSSTTTYTYRLRAADFSGNVSGYSNMATATTFGQWVTDKGSLNVNINNESRSPSIAAVGQDLYVSWSEVELDPGMQTYVPHLYVKRRVGSVWTTVPGAGATPYLNVDPLKAVRKSIIASDGLPSPTPYIAFSECPLGSGSVCQVYVKKRAGSDWALVGTGSLNVDFTQTAVLCSMVFIGGAPYVAWSEKDSTSGIFQVNVRTWNGVAWVDVGSRPLNVSPSADGNAPSLSAEGNVLYAAWSECGGTRCKVHVKKIDVAGSSDWAEVSDTDPAVKFNTKAELPVIAVGPGSVPYVAWQEVNLSTSYQIYVRRYDDATNSWVGVGSGSLNVNPSYQATSPAIGYNGTDVYVAWQESNTLASPTTGFIYVKRWTGSDWELVGGKSLNVSLNKVARSPAIAFAAPDSGSLIPSVVWSEYRELQQTGISVPNIYFSQFK
ncbi:MAG TPA: Ig-like domain-containing protein [Nitrospiria bacterium]|nr:Ig-like domain-containing protein [Nitrospiria bacterium]